MWDLDRFVAAQQADYERALGELRRGRKQSHWMWYIFPQVQGLGHSFMSRRYALSGVEEARAYLAHPVLGPRLLECCRAALETGSSNPREVFGTPRRFEVPLLPDPVRPGRPRRAGLCRAAGQVLRGQKGPPNPGHPETYRPVNRRGFLPQRFCRPCL